MHWRIGSPSCLYPLIYTQYWVGAKKDIEAGDEKESIVAKSRKKKKRKSQSRKTAERPAKKIAQTTDREVRSHSRAEAAQKEAADPPIDGLAGLEDAAVGTDDEGLAEVKALLVTRVEAAD